MCHSMLIETKFSPSITWVLGRTQIVRLDSKHLYQLSHFADPSILKFRAQTHDFLSAFTRANLGERHHLTAFLNFIVLVPQIQKAVGMF